MIKYKIKQKIKEDENEGEGKKSKWREFHYIFEKKKNLYKLV